MPTTARGTRCLHRARSNQEIPFPLVKVSFGRREGFCQDRAVFLARRRVVLTERVSPGIIARCREWERTHAGAERFRDLLVRCSSSATACLARRFASRPASIRTCPGSRARCQMGSLILVGAAISVAVSVDLRNRTQSAHSDGYALLRCQSVPSFLPTSRFKLKILTDFFSPIREPMPPSTAYCSAAAHRPRR